MEYVMNPEAAVNKDHMIANHHVPITVRRRAKLSYQIGRSGFNSGAHVRRQYKPFTNVRFPRLMPMNSFLVAKGIMVVLIPVPGNLPVVIVKPIVFCLCLG